MKLKQFLLLIVLTLNSNSVYGQSNQNGYNFDKLFENLPFEMKLLTLPQFPDKNYNILEFGAIGDGITLNTKAFEKAINECSDNGGGSVIVPAGIWLTGPIIFKENVNLHLEMGALIQFSQNYDEYPIIESIKENARQFCCTSPLMARNIKNIAITGYGVIDGGGETWRYVKKEKLTAIQWDELIKSGGVLDSSGTRWWPTPEAKDALNYISKLKEENKSFTKADAEKYKVFFRPVMLNFVECKNIWFDGVTFENSPGWNLHPFLCENVILTNVNVRNPWYSQNGDGIDVESCKNVLIFKSKFDVGDDAICMKSGKDEEGRKRGRSTENVLIEDCIVYHGHGGFTIGSEMSGGVKNIKVNNCNFIGTSVGLNFKSMRGRGGVVENIYISNIYMKNIQTEAMKFNMYYDGATPTYYSYINEKDENIKEDNLMEEIPVFRKFYLNNIFCIGAKDAGLILGLPEMPIKEVFIENINMVTEKGISISDADGIKIINAKINASSPLVNISQARNILLEKFQPLAESNVIIKLEGNKTAGIIIKGENANFLKLKTQFGKGISNNILKTE